MTKSTIIVYPIFEECKRYTLDDYWKDFFSNCSNNKFPKGFTYDNSKKMMFVKNENGKGFKTFKIPTEAKQAYSKLLEIFRSHGLKSTRDVYFEKEEYEKMKKTIYDAINVKEWKKIKSKSMKEKLLYDYLMKLVEKYSLTYKERSHLFSVISIAKAYKRISSDHIMYEDGEIKGIVGLVFNKQTRTFRVKNVCKKKPVKAVQPKDTFAIICEKYIKDEIEKMPAF